MCFCLIYSVLHFLVSFPAKGKQTFHSGQRGHRMFLY